jgi:hypothetical protein
MISRYSRRAHWAAVSLLLFTSCQVRQPAASVSTERNGCQLTVPRSADGQEFDHPIEVLATVSCGANETDYAITLINLTDQEFDRAFAQYIKCTSPDLSIHELRKTFPITMLGRLANEQKCYVPLMALKQLQALRTSNFQERVTSYSDKAWSDPAAEIAEMTGSEHSRGVRSGIYWGNRPSSAEKPVNIVCIHHEYGFRGTATDEVIERPPSRSATDCLFDYLDEVEYER